MKLSHLETGKAIMEAQGGIQIRRPGTGRMIVPLSNVQFQALGPYTFSLNLTEARENLTWADLSEHLSVRMLLIDGIEYHAIKNLST